MIKINIFNETAPLKVVLVGIAHDFGGIPAIGECYDPKSKEHVLAGTFSKNEVCIKEISALVEVFQKYDVKVYRPKNIKDLNQIFSRDIAFVIEDKLILPNIIKDRRKEIKAIDSVLTKIETLNKIKMPDNTRVEGGDVILCGEYIFGID